MATRVVKDEWGFTQDTQSCFVTWGSLLESPLAPPQGLGFALWQIIHDLATDSANAQPASPNGLVGQSWLLDQATNPRAS